MTEKQDFESLVKLLSTPGAVASALVWLHYRTKRVEDAVNLIAGHIGAPRPVKIRYRGKMLMLLSILLSVISSGCAFVRISDPQGHTVINAAVPAWPWQDSTRTISGITIASRTNNFTARMTGFEDSQVTSTNAATITENLVGAVVRAAVSAAK